MKDRKLNPGDSDEVAAIDRRIAEINAEREKLLQQKQNILNRAPQSQQPQTKLTTEQKIRNYTLFYLTCSLKVRYEN